MIKKNAVFPPLYECKIFPLTTLVTSNLRRKEYPQLPKKTGKKSYSSLVYY